MDDSTDTIDKSSRLKQFAWEICGDRIVAVIFRPAEYGLRRLVLKRYAEQVLSSSKRLTQLSIYFSQLSPSIHAYTMTLHEVALMQWILDFHLSNKLHIRVNEFDDQLIDYEELIDLISHAKKLSNKMTNIDCHRQSFYRPFQSIPTILSTYTVPSIDKPLKSQSQSSPQKTSPSASISSEVTQQSASLTNNCHVPVKSDPSVQSSIVSQNLKVIDNGWIQINNTFVPYIVKKHQRLVPYFILVACKILEPNELHSFATPATSSEIASLNSMTRDRKINNGKLPNQSLLIDIHHVLIGAKNLIYMKLLPKDDPASKINRQYQNILSVHGGFLNIANRPMPFVCRNDHCYVSLHDILAIYPKLHMQLKRLTSIPRTEEFDYLELLRMYSDGEELPLDTVLISMGELNQRQIEPLKRLTLIDYRAGLKAKFEADMIASKKSLTRKRKAVESDLQRGRVY